MGNKRWKVKGIVNEIHIVQTWLRQPLNKQVTGKIEADVCNTEYGPTTDLEHLHLPDNVKLSITR